MLVFNLAEIGNRLFTFRKQAGLTQLQLAVASDISEHTYADIERGTANMRVKTMLKICATLHITPDELLTKDEENVTMRQEELFERLSMCSPEDREIVLRLLTTYLQSVAGRPLPPKPDEHNCSPHE